MKRQQTDTQREKQRKRYEDAWSDGLGFIYPPVRRQRVGWRSMRLRLGTQPENGAANKVNGVLRSNAFVKCMSLLVNQACVIIICQQQLLITPDKLLNSYQLIMDQNIQLHSFVFSFNLSCLDTCSDMIFYWISDVQLFSPVVLLLVNSIWPTDQISALFRYDISFMVKWL